MKFKKWMEKRILAEADKRVITGRAPLSNTSAGLLGPGGVYGDPNRPSYGKQVLAAAGSAIGTSLADELGKPSSIPHLQDPVGMFQDQKQSFDELPLQLPLINGKPIEGIRIANDKQNILSILNNMLYINPRIRILTDSIDGGDKFEIYKEDEKTQALLREKFKSGDLLTIAKSFTTALSKARLYNSFKTMDDFKNLDNKYDLVNPSILKQILKPHNGYYTLGNIFLYKLKKTYLDPNDHEQEEG
jgi:hypothetical protein